VIELRGNQPLGLFYFILAKAFATLDDVASCAHYLKMSRDEGYKKFTSALKDPASKRFCAILAFARFCSLRLPVLVPSLSPAV